MIDDLATARAVDRKVMLDRLVGALTESSAQNART